MTKSIKISFGLFMTIAFCILITLISITDIVAGAQVGFDISGFTIYAAAILKLATAHVKENKGGK